MITHPALTMEKKRAIQRRASKKYSKTPKGIANRKRYRNSEKGKSKGFIYRQTEKYKLRARKRVFLYRYGLTFEEIGEMLTRQENRCALCKDLFTEERPYVVDHNHADGSVRGLVHRGCNVILGLAHDSIDFLKLAINYLEEKR